MEKIYPIHVMCQQCYVINAKLYVHKEIQMNQQNFCIYIYLLVNATYHDTMQSNDLKF
jgi:hypothetical protein